MIPAVILNDLPDYIMGFGVDFDAYARLAAFPHEIKGSKRSQGSSSFGHYDVPVGSGLELYELRDEFCYAQINLAEIPAQVRKPGWPEKGVLWVFMDPHAHRWEVQCVFDPRDASEIKWEPSRRDMGEALEWQVEITMPSEIMEFTQAGEEFMAAYEGWVIKHFLDKHRGWERYQVGGHFWPIQMLDTEPADDFLALEGMHFGDCGAIYIAFKDGEFTGWATTN